MTSPADVVRRLQAQADREKWTAKLRSHLMAYGIRGPELVEEHRFMTDRLFRFDFALPDLRIGIEVEGGVHADQGDRIEAAGGMLSVRKARKSRHVTSGGYGTDCDKYNLAARAGWCVLRFTPRHVKSGAAARFIHEVYEERKAKP